MSSHRGKAIVNPARDWLRKHPEVQLSGVRVTYGAIRRWQRGSIRSTGHEPLQLPRGIVRDAEIPPVFVLSAGWRSGSTAVQRLLSSAGEAFVWGEPYPTAQILARLSRTIDEGLRYEPYRRHVRSAGSLDASVGVQWIANAYPPPEYFLSAVRGYLESMYWSPLSEGGFRTWGVKEVNLRPVDVRLLMESFPDGKFIFLVRDPREAYASFRRYVVWGFAPAEGVSVSKRVGGPLGYGRVWSELAAEFHRLCDRPNVLAIRYEDIVGNASFPDTLAQFAGVTVQPDAWGTQVGAVSHTGSWLQSQEVRLLWRRVRASARLWGYS